MPADTPPVADSAILSSIRAPNRARRRIAATIGVALAVAVAAPLVFIYSGIFDITATNPHFDITHRILTTVKDQSIKSQARDIKVPELDDPAKVHAGFRNYQAMCVSCHNAPGAEESELSKGLYPPAPNLAEAAPNRTSAELYMIIKHGIKMSGMPAWEPTHSGDEIWGLVAFLRVLPDMSPEEYRAAAESTKAAGKGEDMRH